MCAPCGRKIVFGSLNPKKFEINEDSEKLKIKDFYPSYDSSNPAFPLCICTTCRLTLQEHNNNKTKRPIPVMPDYNKILLQHVTRKSNTVECSCYICLKARSKVHTKVVKGRGHTRSEPLDITKDNGLYAALPQKKSHENSQNFNKSVSNDNVIKICKKCLAKVSKGYQHNCDVRGSQPVKNANLIINESLNEKQKDQVCVSILKRKVEPENELKIKKLKNGSVSLSTPGTSMQLTLNPEEQKKMTFTEQNLNNLQTSIKASANDMKKIANFLRCGGGKKVVPLFYSQQVSSRAKLL